MPIPVGQPLKCAKRGETLKYTIMSFAGKDITSVKLFVAKGVKISCPA